MKTEKYTKFIRNEGSFDGVHIKVTHEISVVWNKNLETVYRYMKRYYPELSKSILYQYYEEPLSGIIISYNEAEKTLTLKSKCAHDIPYDDIENTYIFDTPFLKRLALQQVVVTMSMYTKLTKKDKEKFNLYRKV
jgi:hypothetical protein